MSGAMTDAILKKAAIEGSQDNLTVVIVAFENLLESIDDRAKPATPPKQNLMMIQATPDPELPK